MNNTNYQAFGDKIEDVRTKRVKGVVEVKKRNMEKLFREMINRKLADKVKNEAMLKVVRYGTFKF